VKELVAGGLAFVAALAAVPLLVRYALGRNLLDMPNDRSSHEVPTPRLGGPAIMVATWIGFAILHPAGAWPLLVAATLIGAVGLADDLKGLHFSTKASCQALAAAGLVFFHPPQLLSEAPGAVKVAVFVLGVFWVAALSNAFNFMDGIDGITGGVAIASALFLYSLAGDAGAFLPALAGAAAGFLAWNISPASTFCGDAGSYFLGFALAVAALYAPVPSGGWSPLTSIACALVFTPYLFDTAYTLLRRLRAGKNIFSAHREHIYQRITPSTSLHRRTSNLYYGASVLAGFAALLFAEGGAASAAGAALAIALCTALAALPHLKMLSR
jgi:UDP-N-acetylmuramyl pentapeptide phosphotransferase/UDP-N-acetylglucosamine-1-phosphate transferase